MKLGLGVLAMALSCLACSAVAADAASGVNQGFYLGLDAGKSYVKFSDDMANQLSASLARDVAGGGSFATFTKTFNKSKCTYGLFGGYTLDQNWAVEFGYQVFGKPSAEFVVRGWAESVDTGPSIFDVKIVRTSKVSDVYAAVVGRMPVYPGVDLYGKLGAAYVTCEETGVFYMAPPNTNSWSQTSSVGSNPYTNTEKTRKMAGLLGLGVSYNVGSNVDLRLEYRYIPKAFKSPQSSLKDIQSLTLGLAFSF